VAESRLWIDESVKVSRRSRRFLVVALAALLGGCSAGSPDPPHFPPLTKELVAAVNYQYSHGVKSTPPTTFSIASASISPSQESAAQKAVEVVVRDCNEGSGAWILGVGLVNSSFSGQPIFAVFVNPPGSHIPPTSGGLGVVAPSSSVTAIPTTQPASSLLNWYAGFIRSNGRVFCTFGHWPHLPALPVHG
jgi:hypothetical protein